MRVPSLCLSLRRHIKHWNRAALLVLSIHLYNILARLRLKVGSLLKIHIAFRGPTCFPVPLLTASLTSAQGHIMQILLRKNQDRPSACYLGCKKFTSVCAKPMQEQSKASLNNLRINDVAQRRLSVKIGSRPTLTSKCRDVPLYLFQCTFVTLFIPSFLLTKHVHCCLSKHFTPSSLHKH